MYVFPYTKTKFRTGQLLECVHQCALCVCMMGTATVLLIKVRYIGTEGRGKIHKAAGFRKLIY